MMRSTSSLLLLPTKRISFAEPKATTSLAGEVEDRPRHEGRQEASVQPDAQLVLEQGAVAELTQVKVLHVFIPTVLAFFGTRRVVLEPDVGGKRKRVQVLDVGLQVVVQVGERNIQGAVSRNEVEPLHVNCYASYGGNKPVRFEEASGSMVIRKSVVNSHHLEVFRRCYGYLEQLVDGHETKKIFLLEFLFSDKLTRLFHEEHYLFQARNSSLRRKCLIDRMN